MTTRKYLFLMLFLSLYVFTYSQQEYQEGIRYFENRDWNKCIQYFKTKLNEKKESSIIYHYLGAAYLENKNYKAGYDILSEGVKKFPGEKALIGNFLNAGILIRVYNEPLKYATDYLNKNPKDTKIKELIASFYLSMAETQKQNKNFQKATENIQNSLKYNSQSEEAYLLLIYVNIEKENSKEAVREAEKANKLFPNSSRVKTAYLNALIADGNYEKALTIGVKLKDRLKDDIDFQLQLVMLYRANYKTQEAASLLENLLSRFPKNETVYDGAIRYFESINGSEKIRELYEAKIKVFGRETEFRKNIAETYIAENNYYKARDVYDEILKTKNDNEIRMLIAGLYIEEGKKDSAEIEAIEILKTDEGNYEALKLLCGFYSEKKEGEKLIGLAAKFKEYHPKDFYPDFYLSKGYFINSDFASAKGFADSAIIKNRKNPYPFEILSDINIIKSESSEAQRNINLTVKNAILLLEEFETKINMLMQEVNVNSKISKKSDAYTLKNEINEIQRIIEKSFLNLRKVTMSEKLKTYIEGFVTKYPKNPLILIKSADYYRDEEILDTAEALYKKALYLNPNISEGHFGLSLISAKRGDYQEAIKSLKRTLAIVPDNQEAYNNIISYSITSGKNNELADDWMKIYKTDKTNKILKERLIELLHKSNRFDDAKEIINDTGNN